MAPALSFMGLPVDIRARILRYTDIISLEAIGFTWEIRKAMFGQDYESTFRKERLQPLAIELLLVNRQLHSEAARILYGKNVFYIPCLDRRSRYYLRKLQQSTLQLLRNIHIVSNMVNYRTRWINFDCIMRTSHTRRAHSIEEVRHSWSFLSQLLGELHHCRISIELDLCDFDIEISEQILRDMYHFPRIHNIRMQLGNALRTQLKNPQHDLRLINHRFFNLMTDSPPKCQHPFPFERLPIELQRQVLTYTDLVHRSKHMVIDIYSGGNTECCKRCSTSYSGCFCNRQLGCVSSTCTCWTYNSVLSLFLTSKQMSLEAHKVFYLSNTFAVHYPLAKVGSWLQQLGGSLRCIRDIMLVGYGSVTKENLSKLVDIFVHGGHPKLWLKIYLRDPLGLPSYAGEVTNHGSATVNGIISVLEGRSQHIAQRISLIILAPDNAPFNQAGTRLKFITLLGPPVLDEEVIRPSWYRRY